MPTSPVMARFERHSTVAGTLAQRVCAAAGLELPFIIESQCQKS